MRSEKKGFGVINDGRISKSLAFSKQEREQLSLRGLLLYSEVSQNIQMKRVLDGLRRKDSNIQRYIMLSVLQDHNQRLYYYRILSEHIEEIMPIVYTPTLGEACLEFSHIFRKAKGFYITPDELFLMTAKTLVEMDRERDIEYGAVYPELNEIRTISLENAMGIAE